MAELEATLSYPEFIEWIAYFQNDNGGTPAAPGWQRMMQSMRPVSGLQRVKGRFRVRNTNRSNCALDYFGTVPRAAQTRARRLKPSPDFEFFKSSALSRSRSADFFSSESPAT